MQKPALVACIFDAADSAIDTIHELRGTGFSDDQIGLVVRYDADGGEARKIIDGLLGVAGISLLPPSETNHNEPASITGAKHTQEKRTTGIIIGGIIGGTLGTVAVLKPPEIGLIVVGGMLTAVMGDATQGGIAAHLLRTGIPIDQAHYYEQQFQAGCILFMIKADEQQQDIQDILHYHRAHDINVH